MAALEEPKKKRKKKKKENDHHQYSKTTGGTTSPAAKSRERRSDSRLSTSRHSPFPSADMDVIMLRQKCNEYEQQIKSLTRDNRVLAKKIEKTEAAAGKKSKKIDDEKDMRLRANRERYALKQKLDRLQKALEARLKMLGIDFSNINDLAEALEAAFAAIQKLAAELAKKEEELSAMSAKMEKAQREQEEAVREVDKLNRKMAKSKNATTDLKKQIEERDRRLSIVAKQKKSTEDGQSALQGTVDKLRSELDALRAAKSKEFDNFVDRKAEMDSKLKAMEKKNEDLREEMKEMEGANERLKEENGSLKKELESLRNDMDAQGLALKEQEERNEELSKEIENLKNDLNSSQSENKELKESNQNLSDELEKLKAQLADALAQLAAQKKAVEDLEAAKQESEEESQAMFEEQKMMNETLKKKLAKLEEQIKEQAAAIQERDDELSSLQNSLSEERAAKESLTKDAAATTKNNDEMMAALNSEKSELRQMVDSLKEEGSSKDDEIARLKRELEEAQQALDAHLNKPVEDKQTQTELTGKWIENSRMQLNNLDNIFKENEELRKLATKNDDRLIELADENRVLLDEIDTLLKQQAQFRPDTSNHRGEVLAMCAAPNTYMAATSAKDKSVRLWTIDPKQAKSKDQVKPTYRAQMEGIALSLAYTRDGTYLVAGCAYKNGPDGLLIVWNMLKGDGEVEFLFRSRPSVRFGRAQCVRWSNDNKYIFSGDTTGSIWIWDVANQIQLAVVMAHSDVLHDIGIAGNALFSCALDQTISVFDMKRLETKLKKKKRHAKKHSQQVSMGMDKIHVHQPHKFKAKQLDRNDKYPYWVVDPTEDGTMLVAGSRKINIWKFSGFTDEDDSKKQVSECSLEKGPRVTDSDLEHVQSLQVRRGQMVICRRDVPRAKIFSATNGTETAKAKFKSPPKRIQFTFDTEHCVVCCQKQDGKHAKPPSMHLWNYKN